MLMNRRQSFAISTNIVNIVNYVKHVNTVSTVYIVSMSTLAPLSTLSTMLTFLKFNTITNFYISQNCLKFKYLHYIIQFSNNVTIVNQQSANQHKFDTAIC